jgi:hypothetical protein
MKGYKSKLEISKKSQSILINFLNKFLEKNKTVYCKAFKRKISLKKLPEVITERGSSTTRRLQRFWVSIDILKHEKKFIVNSNNNSEFTIY